MLGTSDFGACCGAILLFPAQAVCTALHGLVLFARGDAVNAKAPAHPRVARTHAKPAAWDRVGFGITLGAP
jgi:hypothetical protein